VIAVIRHIDSLTHSRDYRVWISAGSVVLAVNGPTWELMLDMDSKPMRKRPLARIALDQISLE